LTTVCGDFLQLYKYYSGITAIKQFQVQVANSMSYGGKI
jgi:hypothetical protein